MADVATGVLDVEHTVVTSGEAVTVCFETTRCVGSVDVEGFLVHAQQHIDQGTLAATLVLTLRARISAIEVGRTFGVPGAAGLLDVEVFLHKGTSQRSSATGRSSWPVPGPWRGTTVTGGPTRDSGPAGR